MVRKATQPRKIVVELYAGPADGMLKEVTLPDNDIPEPVWWTGPLSTETGDTVTLKSTYFPWFKIDGKWLFRFESISPGTEQPSREVATNE